jgi:transposase
VRFNYFKLENQVLNIEVNYKTITTLNNEKIYSALLFLFLSVASAQAPSGYYSTATGTGYTLKPNYTK